MPSCEPIIQEPRVMAVAGSSEHLRLTNGFTTHVQHHAAPELTGFTASICKRIDTRNRRLRLRNVRRAQHRPAIRPIPISPIRPAQIQTLWLRRIRHIHACVDQLPDDVRDVESADS
jgi:hypothetical protein